MWRAAASALALTALLVGCGGGDGVDPTSSYLSVYVGTTGANRDLTGVVLPDGSYYLVYSAVGDPATVGGAVQGTSVTTDGAFTSADALDFSAEGAGIKPSTIAATIVPASSFAGTITATAGGTPVTFQSHTTGGIPPAASLANLAGTYTGNAGFALGVRPAVFAVAADGSVSSTINGCAITGKATPRTDGNAYDLTIAFGGAPCALPGLGFAGIAFQRPDNGKLYAVARNATYKQSVIFEGAR